MIYVHVADHEPTNSQETEEALEEMKQNIAQTKQKMETETEVLKQVIFMIRGTLNG
jgi:hypothetical protein